MRRATTNLPYGKKPQVESKKASSFFNQIQLVCCCDFFWCLNDTLVWTVDQAVSCPILSRSCPNHFQSCPNSYSIRFRNNIKVKRTQSHQKILNGQMRILSPCPMQRKLETCYDTYIFSLSGIVWPLFSSPRALSIEAAVHTNRHNRHLVASLLYRHLRKVKRQSVVIT